MKMKAISDIKPRTILIFFGLFFTTELMAQHRMAVRMDSTGNEIFTPYNRPSASVPNNTPVQNTVEPNITHEQKPDTFLVHPMVPWVKKSKAAKLAHPDKSQPVNKDGKQTTPESLPASTEKQQLGIPK